MNAIKRLAIVPARGGSKRILKKNIREFCGKPMISYVLNTASRSKLFDVVHVSTECNEIALIAKNHKANVDFLRPKNLADDMTPLAPVIKEVVREFRSRGAIFDEIWLLMACSPILSINELISAAKIFSENIKIKKMIAVSEYQVPIEWAYKMNEDGWLTPENPGSFSMRSQDIEKKYFDAGSFVAFKADQINDNNLDDSGYFGFKVSKETAIDIDTPEDWKFAEHIFSSIIKSKE